MNEDTNLQIAKKPPLVIPDDSNCPFSIVFNEDCVQGLKRFADNYFDLAIVDPPYGFRTEKTGILNFRKGKQEKEWNVAPTAEYFYELKRVSKNQIVWGVITFPNYG